MLRKTFVIALVALIASACCSSRQATKEVSTSTNSATSTKVQEFKDSVKVEKVTVAVHDTIMETVTIVVDRNEAGDTLKLSTVTERDRIRDRAQVRNQHERVVVKTDTVFVATRDSVSRSTFQDSRGSSRASPVVLTLKWVFWIIVAVTVLVIVLRFKLFNMFK